MFFWVKFNENIDTMRLFDEAIEENVAFVLGSVFLKTTNQAHMLDLTLPTQLLMKSKLVSKDYNWH